MHYSGPYKLQLNLEISSSNMLEILKQLSRLTKDTDINTSFTLPEAIHDTSGEHLETHVVSLIHEIGIPSHIMGYQYLKDAVHITMRDRDTINSITKVLKYCIRRLRQKTTQLQVELNELYGMQLKSHLQEETQNLSPLYLVIVSIPPLANLQIPNSLLFFPTIFA